MKWQDITWFRAQKEGCKTYYLLNVIYDDTTEEWNLAGELLNLENKNHLEAYEEKRMAWLIANGIFSSYCEDESNVCDWNNPAEVNFIGPGIED